MSSAIEVLKKIRQDNYLTGVQLPAFSQDEANKKKIDHNKLFDFILKFGFGIILLSNAWVTFWFSPQYWFDSGEPSLVFGLTFFLFQIIMIICKRGYILNKSGD